MLHEVQIRDSLIAETQNEVNRRDELLTNYAAEIDRLLHEVQIRDSLIAETQNEVNRRDELLANHATEVASLRLEVLRQNTIIEKQSQELENFSGGSEGNHNFEIIECSELILTEETLHVSNET